ncbi:hypothetical protein SBOR_1578 [Sclerotinia borealis F-4128]|uniref:Uncharacterized protein n=1 Tax=Sclerotinia borealis (strain F-4128) TaxID=1432307 RepID=W9CMM4_SCLBF|nr:hypothetical protein SBOR_1578 [Sclerotinia borealis F-4128]
MVDDSMEIASEHGHNIVEGDIDIDIDLTTGHIDEDDILDDIDADADFDTNIVDVPAQTETDDLMLDDVRDDTSYHMEDADQLEEEADDHIMEQEPAGMSFATDAHYSFNEIHPADPSNLDAGVSDQFWDDPQLAQQSDDAADAQDTEATVHGAENAIANGPDSAFNLNAKDIQELAPVSFPHLPTDEDTRSNSPQNPNYNESNGESLESNLNEPTDPVEAVDHNIYAEDETHLDLNKVSSKSGSINPNVHAEDQEEEHPDPNIASPESGSVHPNEAKFEPSKDTEDQYHAREIVVKYNNRNYPLIRKSSADHPNEFFFEDPSVVEKSFNEFCVEIRKVLLEENLPKDDKISLVVEELQLVIEEIQLTDYPDDLSLGQIIRLYEKLVNNDGTEDIPPLNLRLIIQPTGRDRFLALSKGAAEGKGLLDYVTWDADSEDDPTEFGEPTEHYDSESPGGECNPELEEVETSIEASVVLDKKFDPDSRDEQPRLEHLDSATSASAEVLQGEQNKVQRDVNAQQSAPVELRHSSEILQKPDDEIDEDGDFIDYEDEENVEKPPNNGTLKSELPETDESRPHNGRSTDFNLPCILPATCLCSTCNDLFLTECRAAEEESRRNSISLRTENLPDELDDQVGDETSHNNDAAAQPNETLQDVESDIDYEEDNAEEENADDNFNADENEQNNENFDAEEEQITATNGIENAEHTENLIDLNGTNEEDCEYTSYNDNNEIEQHVDGEGHNPADHTLQASYDDNNRPEQNGDGESLDLEDHSLEVDNVDISFAGDDGNAEQHNFEEDEFDLGVGDEEENEFLLNYQLDDDTTLNGNNESMNISVGEDTTTAKFAFDGTAAETDSATLSNASITELQGMKPSLVNGQDQEDEIDYEDDEEDLTSPVIVPQPPTPASKGSPVSNFGKRPIAETDFEDDGDSITNG